MTKPEASEGASQQVTSELRKHETEPLIERVYSARTMLDRRKRALNERPHLKKIAALANIPVVHRGPEIFFQIEDESTGVDWLSKEDHPVFRYGAGSYGSTFQPETLQSLVSGTRYTAETLFDFCFGDKKAPLDQLGIGEPLMRDWIAVRFKEEKVTIDTTFMDAVAQHKAPQIHGDEFEAVWLVAQTKSDAGGMLSSTDFDATWWKPVPVDQQRRPLERWCTARRWHATDEAALREAQRATLAQKRRELKRRLAEAEAELRLELGL